MLTDTEIRAAKLRDRNQVRAANNKARRFPERCKMMQAWADYLHGRECGAFHAYGWLICESRTIPDRSF